MKKIKLVVFDIDHTLLGETQSDVRPFLWEVLREMSGTFELGIWSCGSRIEDLMTMAKENVGFVDWRCVLNVEEGADYKTKDLRVVEDITGYDPGEIALVDDDRWNDVFNTPRGFFVYVIPPFYAQAEGDDVELVKMRDKLIQYK